jgi:DNA invertase Pin-like site-specific DNA recombinase
MMQMVASFAEFERAMICERTSAGLAAARAEGRIGGRRKKLDAAKRREIAESVITGRKTGAEMARLYNVSAPTVSRIVAEHRVSLTLIRTAERHAIDARPDRADRDDSWSPRRRNQ